MANTGETCQFFVQRKKRFCKMLVKSGNKYCGQHQVEELEENDSKLKRIPCPLDPKHSCYEHRLQKHLEICNAKEVLGFEYIKKNVNLGLSLEEPLKVSLSSLSDVELLSFIKKVEVVHKEHVGEIEKAKLSHELLVKEISTPGYGPSVTRHLSQNSSILGHLSQEGFLDTSSCPTCFIEFGAGRGKLTHWLTESVTDISKALFVLIDRGAQRYKLDAKLKYNKELFIQRLRVDIQHLNLQGIDSIENYKRIVGLGKHLCGGATDLTLECLAKQSSQRVAGIVLALCCHHRCTYNAYVGHLFLQEAEFSPKEFYTLTALTSWATCNSKDSEPLQKEDEVPQPNQEPETDNTAEAKHTNENRYTRLGLKAQYREEVGRKAKQVLDYGRVKYLNSQGFRSRLIQYVDKEETLENIALVAVNL
ncbi:tRNA:m(4)X modification enzyme TRM13 homolog [Palaemon carinicauda]|uniref:tRNA:m(4)X modification enzyme TRM13 homolog n=1 Tax=Palaemon carinicauda TaxID=392227 RepID=UPI0035B6090B